jgi:hypothetical protein
MPIENALPSRESRIGMLKPIETPLIERISLRTIKILSAASEHGFYTERGPLSGENNARVSLKAQETGAKSRNYDSNETNNCMNSRPNWPLGNELAYHNEKAFV